MSAPGRAAVGSLQVACPPSWRITAGPENYSNLGKHPDGKQSALELRQVACALLSPSNLSLSWFRT